MSVRNRETQRLKRFVTASLLAAVLILMWLVPFLGYISLGAVEITLMTIPVVIGAIVLGPGYGAFLGGVFGITSFLMAVFGIPSFSLFGATLVAADPICAFIVFFVPRVLMGLLCGLIFKGIARIDRTGIVPYAVTSLSGAVLNTLLFVGLLLLCYYGRGTLAELQLGDSVWAVITTLITVNAAVEAAVCLVVGFAVSKALSKLKL